MAWTKQGSRLALVGYLLVAAVVLGGLTWATVLALRLEQADRAAQQEIDHRRDLRLALFRLDARVQSIIIRETNRSPYEYNPIVFPKDLVHADGRPVARGEVMHRSPLVDQTFEPWLLGHFTVSAQSPWSSPQVYSDRWAGLSRLYLPPPTASAVAAQTLAALRRSLTPHRLGQMLARAQARDKAAWAMGDEPFGAAYVRRRQQADQLLRPPPEVCDDRDLAQMLVDQGLSAEQWSEESDESTPADEPDDLSDDVSFAYSGLTGLWLNLRGEPEPYLAFVRTVSLEGNTIYQGFVVDWPMLRDLLIEEISDLFPNASLLPFGSGPVEDPEELMTFVPARLDVGSCTAHLPPADWSPMHSGLLLAWAAAVTVLVAAGFGVKALLDLAERRSQFAYAVSHELRTPLTTFRLYTDMLADGLVPEGKRDEYLQTINTESQRLAQLVGGVLEYSQLEHHAVQPNQEDITIEELLDTARERFEPHCRDADLQLEINRSEEVARLNCRTDPDLALQIVGALIDNACKYARNARDPRIVLTANNGPSGRVRIEVRDFGPGVSRKERRTIFKPFRRGRGLAADSPGTGLGLALANRWAKLLNGNLELVTDRNSPPGACFRLTLPLHPQATGG